MTEDEINKWLTGNQLMTKSGNTAGSNSTQLTFDPRNANWNFDEDQFGYNWDLTGGSDTGMSDSAVDDYLWESGIMPDWSEPNMSDFDVELTMNENGLKQVGNKVLDTLGNVVGTIQGNRTLANIISAWKTNEDRQMFKEQSNELKNMATTNIINYADKLAQMGGNVDFMQYVKSVGQAVGRGDITAAQATAAIQEESKLLGIKVPQEFIDAQKDVLGRLDEVSKQGYTVIERAAIQKALDQAQTRARGETEAIKSDLQSRGMYNTGQESVMRSMAQQAAANQGSQAALDVEAQAMARAMQALKDRGKMATDLNTQSFDQQKAVASAQDAINQFNAQMQTQVGLANAAQQNQVGIANAQLNQAADFKNIDARNQDVQNALNAIKGQTDTQKGYAQLAGNLYGNAAGNAAGMWKLPYELQIAQINAQNKQLNQALAPNYAGQVGQTGQTGRNPGTGSDISNTMKDIGQVVDTGKKVWDTGKAIWDFFSDEDVKEHKKEMSDEDIMDILDGLVPHSFEYKKGVREMGAPEGKVVGVMAQDIERTPAKGMIVTEQGVKKVKGDEAISLALAALTSLNSRIKNLEEK